MGRHAGSDEADEPRPQTTAAASPLEPSPAPRQSPARPPRVGRVKQAVTVVFAFAASVSFLLVNLVDPFSGAIASSEFASEADRFGGQSVQAIDVAGDYSIDVGQESYDVEKKPEVQLAPASTSEGSGWAPPAVTPDPGSAQAYAATAVAARGWPSSEFDCLVALWNKESGWRVNAYNAGSGAYGIPQALPGSKMATAGADWETNAATQIEWGLGYVSGRYGTPCGAWAHSEDVGWY
ncbi:lytic transglycosylase domain-containing protein [Agromyces cerinus subsp. nitratus]|uniref:aggregation-promoting factor C-terminal-like domain-containing protein n=1 Tax=Agromyces cerinus TaxID=33878 RepID=UPI003625D33B